MYSVANTNVFAGYFAEPWVYAASVTSIKINILLLYRRLFYVAKSKTVGIDRVFRNHVLDRNLLHLRLSHHHVDRHGGCLPSRKLLLETIRRSYGWLLYRCAEVLSGLRNYQHGE